VQNVRISLLLEPAVSHDLFYSVHVSQNRMMARPPVVASEADLKLEAVADLKEGLNCIEIVVAAYKRIERPGVSMPDFMGGHGMMTTPSTFEFMLVQIPGRDPTQKFTVFVQRSL
jgi:hypothetical protein